VAWFICLFVGTTVSFAKMDDLIKILFGGEHSCGPKEPCIRWGVQIPQWDRAVLNSSFSDPLPIEKYREVLYGMVIRDVKREPENR